MDTDKIRRRQNLRVIISEIIMVVTMAATVAVLALVASGYWLNSDFEVERQGMLQISSVPSGASLVIDGETSWFQRTNTSKILSSGEHEIVLKKDGYDTWSRTINISEGLLYRLSYPRLFLSEREQTKVYDTAKFTFATISPDHKSLLLAGDTTTWTLLDLDNETFRPTTLNVAAFLPGVNLTSSSSIGVFEGEVVSADWDSNSEHLLLHILVGDKSEWILLDTINIGSSLNLTREFGADFTRVEIFDNSASTLLVVESGDLRKIDTRNKTISSALVKDIVDFDHFGDEIAFSARRAGGDYYLGLTRIGSSIVTELATLATPAQIAIFQFYDDKYIAVLSGAHLALYQKDDYLETSSFDFSFAPATLLVGQQGDFLTMTDGGSRIATLDMEDNSACEWSVDGSHFDWLGPGMIFSVQNGTLFVYDFNGLNRRELASNVSCHFPVTITSDKWLYYFSDGNLVREVIAK